jgi:hypothetical protein
MPKDNACDTGKRGYPTKREAEKSTGSTVKRCDRCKQWHSTESIRGRRKAKV